MNSSGMLKAVATLAGLPNYCCHSSGQHHDSKLSLLVYLFECKAQQIDCQIIYLPITQRDCTGPQSLDILGTKSLAAMESLLPQSGPVCAKQATSS